MKLKKIDWLIIFFLLLISIFAVKALFHSGFYTSHDGEHQVIRLNHYLIGLRDGQWPVRWAGPPAFNGFGYPLFIFTYRLPFFLGAIFSLIGFSLVDSVKAVFILSYCLSGIFMYLAQRKIWRKNLAALIGAIFYLWAPWRFSIIFVRASLGEAVCFLFFPLIIWSVLALQEKERKITLLLGAFSLAGLLLSHAMLTFLFLPFLVGLMGFCLWQTQKRKSLVFNYLKLFLLSLSLSAYYWLPAMVETKVTLFGKIISDFYLQHFPTLKQLVYSPWGYGFSFPGSEQDAMSFQVGLAQWLAIFLAIFVLVWLRLRKERQDFFQRLNGFFILLFMTAVFLMMPASKPYWQFASQFFKIDFPFRYLALTTLFSSLIAGGLIAGIKKDKFLKWLFYPTIVGFLFLIFYGNRNHLRVNQYLSLPDSFYEENLSSSNSFDEYRPLWVSGNLPKRETALAIGEGEAVIETQEIRSNRQEFQVAVQKESFMTLNTIYYPGWRLMIDGKEQGVGAISPAGLMQFSLPVGKHTLIFKFERTWDRMTGEIITLTALGLIIYQSARRWKRPKRRK
jgi:hypothetical protein